MRSLRQVLLVAVAAAAALALGIGTALADPRFVPDPNDIVGVGSDTTYPVLNAYANAYNSSATRVRQLASYDPIGTNPVVVRQGASAINRPNGSSAGLLELARRGSPVDFARVARSPRAGDGGVTFIPFAKDNLRYVFDNSGSNAITNLTWRELRDIYNCASRTWASLRAGSSTATIEPKIPRNGGDGRIEFLASINVITPGSCVQGVQQNSVNSVDGQPNAISPFSQARYAMLPTPRPIALNSANSYIFGNLMYNAVRNSVAAADLAAVFGPSGTGYVCSNPSLMTGLGFQTLNPSAGDPVCGSQIVTPQ